MICHTRASKLYLLFKFCDKVSAFKFYKFCFMSKVTKQKAYCDFLDGRHATMFCALVNWKQLRLKIDSWDLRIDIGFKKKKEKRKSIKIKKSMFLFSLNICAIVSQINAHSYKFSILLASHSFI